MFCLVRLVLLRYQLPPSCSPCSGNTLGTRYTPCQAASESIFSPCPSTPTAPSTSRPLRPFGPSYWNARPVPHRRSSCSMSGMRTTPPSYYTFFADRVTASPAHDYRSQSVAAPTLVEPGRSSSRPISPEIDYGYRWTASPQTVSTPLPITDSTAAPSNPAPTSPVFALPPLPPLGRNISQLRPSSSVRTEPRLNLTPPPLVVSTAAGEPGLDLDRDGVPLVEMEEPGSPDKEGMSWPGR